MDLQFLQDAIDKRVLNLKAIIEDPTTDQYAFKTAMDECLYLCDRQVHVMDKQELFIAKQIDGMNTAELAKAAQTEKAAIVK